jgi:hypothetical protein
MFSHRKPGSVALEAQEFRGENGDCRTIVGLSGFEPVEVPKRLGIFDFCVNFTGRPRVPVLP